jgi:hypothetical protein
METFDCDEYAGLLQKQLDALDALDAQTLQGHISTLTDLPMEARPLAEAYLHLHDAADLLIATTRELFAYVEQLEPGQGVSVTRGRPVHIELTGGPDGC